MNSDNISEMCSILAQMPGDPKWDGDHADGLMQFYTLGLDDLPDAATVPLIKAIVLGCTTAGGGQFRPGVPAIREMWRKIQEPKGALGLAEVLAELRRLVARFGEYGALHAEFSTNPNIRSLGATPELSALPLAARRAVSAMGGWVEFARSADFGNPVFQSQFRRLYESAAESSSDTDLRQIQLDYQATIPKAAEALPEPSANNFERRATRALPDRGEPSRDEASDVLRKFMDVGSLIKRL